MKFVSHWYQTQSLERSGHCSFCTASSVTDKVRDGSLPSSLIPLQDARSTRCTKLHNLCIQGQPDVEDIMTFIRKHPLSTRCMDHFGRSPLFWLIKLGQPDNLIQNVYNETPPEILVSPDYYGKTCIDLLYAPKTRNIGLLRWFLSRDPSLALFRAPFPSGMPLLHRICIRWSLSTKADPFDLEILLTIIDATHRHLCCRCSLWKPDGIECALSVLHMAMDLSLPSIVLHKLARLFPDNLHPSCPVPFTIMPLHFFLSHYTPTNDKNSIAFLLHLLECEPDAAQKPFWSTSGKKLWPLHIAIENGYTWVNEEVINKLVLAAPAVLHEADEKAGLLPFQIAATAHCDVSEPCQVNTIYHLLRAQPSVLYK